MLQEMIPRLAFTFPSFVSVYLRVRDCSECFTDKNKLHACRFIINEIF